MLVFFSCILMEVHFQSEMYSRTGKTDTTWCWCPSLKPGGIRDSNMLGFFSIFLPKISLKVETVS